MRSGVLPVLPQRQPHGQTRSLPDRTPFTHKKRTLEQYLYPFSILQNSGFFLLLFVCLLLLLLLLFCQFQTKLTKLSSTCRSYTTAYVCLSPCPARLTTKPGKLTAFILFYPWAEFRTIHWAEFRTIHKKTSSRGTLFHPELRHRTWLSYKRRLTSTCFTLAPHAVTETQQKRHVDNATTPPCPPLTLFTLAWKKQVFLALSRTVATVTTKADVKTSIISHINNTSIKCKERRSMSQHH